MGREMGRWFKREGTYVYLWLIHIVVWQKPNQFCKTIILKINKQIYLFFLKQRSHFSNKVQCRQIYPLPVVMYRCENWTIKKAEHQRIDAFELWCWRRLLRVPWTARQSNQSILKEVNLNIHWKNWCWSWSWSSNTLATWCKDPTHWKRPWC